MTEVAVVHKVDDWVLGSTSFLIRNAPEAENLHVAVSCKDSHRKNVDLEERLLEHIGKEIPIFLGERALSQLVFPTGVANGGADHQNGNSDK